MIREEIIASPEPKKPPCLLPTRTAFRDDDNITSGTKIITQTKSPGGTTKTEICFNEVGPNNNKSVVDHFFASKFDPCLLFGSSPSYHV